MKSKFLSVLSNQLSNNNRRLLFTIIILTLFITYTQTSYLNETYLHIKFQIRFCTLLVRAIYNLLSANRRKKLGLELAAASLKNHTATCSSSSSSSWPDPPLDLFHNSTKLIWAYWHSGSDNLSPLGEVSLQSWKAHHHHHHHNNNLSSSASSDVDNDWKIIILSDTNYQQYVPSSHIPSTFELLKVQFRSDIVRLSVLARYGGAYLDMTTLLMKSLDGIWESELRRVEKEKKMMMEEEGGSNDGGRVYSRIFVPTVLELEMNINNNNNMIDEQQQQSSLPPAASTTSGLVTNSVILSPQPNNPILLKFLSRILQYSENPASTALELKSRPEFKRVLPYMNAKDNHQLGILAQDGTLLYSAHLWIFTDLILFDEELEAGKYFVDLPALRWTYDFMILPHTLARFDETKKTTTALLSSSSSSCSTTTTTTATIHEQLQNERIHTWNTWHILKHALWGMVPWQEFDDPNLVDYTIQNVVMFKTSTDGGSLQNQRSYNDLMNWKSSFGRLYRRAIEGTGMNATLEGARLFGYGAPMACSFELDNNDNDVEC